MYRTRGRVGASHDSTPGAGGTTRPGRGAGCGRLAGPARVRRATARQISHVIYLGHFLRPHENVAIPTIRIQSLKQRDGNYVRNCSDGGKACSAHIRIHSPRAHFTLRHVIVEIPGFETTHRATHQRPSPTGVEGAGGAGGAGCGARGRWRGLAGLRDDAPSEARGADGSRAGRRPRAHKAARPHSRIRRRPKHQRGTSNKHTYKNAHPEPGGRI